MKEFDVLIVGGGVTGTAAFYVLNRYTNINSIGLLEKNGGVAQVNSHPLNNAQTSHDGGTETNYSLGHALEVKEGATLLRNFVMGQNMPGLYKVTNRMVLAIGKKECDELALRFEKFKAFYKDLFLVYRDELAKIEPKVMEGRDPKEQVCALVSKLGFAIDYQKLSECFVKKVEATEKASQIYYSTEIKKVSRNQNGLYILQTNNGEFSAKVVVFAAGAYSLLFAQDFGYGLDYGILSVAGSFFSAGKFLTGKVYRVQIEGMPFAAIHGDPDVLDQAYTRFGPTTKPLFLMERHHYKTFWDYIRLPMISTIRGIVVLLRLVLNKKMFWYVTKNILFDLPIIGKLMFLKEAKIIVPTLAYKDLKLRRGVGGIRPQIVNLKTGKLEMGDSSIVGDNTIFNTTPSPGASICLANAKRDARRVVEFLGSPYIFKEELMDAELGKEVICV